MDEHTAIRVFRDGWLGVMNRYIVKIDGHEVGKLGRRKSLTVPVLEGSHQVAVTVGGGTSRPLDLTLSSGEVVSVEMAFSRRGLSSSPIVGQPNVRDGIVLRQAHQD